MNPFADLYKQCNTGDPADKWANLPAFPRMLDIELTSSCNYRCLMCPTGNLSLKRPATFMDDTTYCAVVEQAAEHGAALRFIGWGEPLLHPNVDDYIAVANQGFVLTHINTNGSKLDMKMARELISAGLGSIKFSFQGVDKKSYAEMRNTDYFEQLVLNIEMMRRERDRYGQGNPWIAVSTSTTYETPEMIEAFKAEIGPYVDELSVGKTIFGFMDLTAARLRPHELERLERLREAESVEMRHPVPCPEVYDKLSIHADGSVVLCCNDFDGVVELGNVNDTPIAELWRHPNIEAYRERLARKDYDAPLCETCWDYQELTEGSMAGDPAMV